MSKENKTKKNERGSGLASADLLALSKKWRNKADAADEAAYDMLDKNPESEIGMCHEQAARTFNHCAKELESLANSID